ncbi:DUF4230 domain-containing protein [Phycisphaerales bacterium AB-hyl4]|uniref:DUF4230 domain-containing protein n=1 Tax=Natronomicrosphaera hydrolytica TaxID=3242702 RepID=A0ABV4U8I0_9BACT
MIRLTLIALLAVIVLAMAILLYWQWLERQRPVTAAWITLEQLQQAAELVTLKVPYQQLVETRVAGYSGSVRCVVLAVGEAWVGTDLEQARWETDPITGTVTLTLAQPRVLSSHLDHDRSRVVLTARRGVWLILPGEAGEPQVIEQALRDAQQQLAASAASEEHIEAARQQAETVLSEQLGMPQTSNVVIQWRP